MIPLCVYSHSDYFDILKIQMDSILALNIPCDIYLFVNTPFTLNGGGRLRYRKVKRRHRTRKRMRGGNNNKFKTIIYDDTQPYFQRLSSCISQVDSPHLILIHDNDILVQCDTNAIDKIVDAMNANDIDAVRLLHAPGNSEIHIKDTLYLSKIGDDDRYVYCVNPRLWRKESALDLYRSLPQTTYKLSEEMDVQEFSKKQKIYALSDTNNVKASKDQYRSKYFLTMNLTRAGKIYPFNTSEHTDPIIKNAYAKLKEKFKNITKRNFYSE